MSEPRGPTSLAAEKSSQNGGSSGRLLTAAQLAERWQLASKAAVYRLARDGQIPTVWIGRYCRFRLDAIEAWEAAGGKAADE